MSTDPAEILARVDAAYAACTSYRDEGIVTTTFLSPMEFVELHPFSTRFVRGQGFLFEFRDRREEDDRDQYVVWTEKGLARTWWSKSPETDERSSLGLALAGATGVSGGSASRVPRLLMPEIVDKGSVRPPQPARLLRLPEADAEGCFVLERALFIGSEQVWIDRTTLLIRRVVEPPHRHPPSPEQIERMKATDPKAAAEMARMAAYFAGSEYESVKFGTTTEYDAAFGAAIRPDELVFTPPS